MGYYGKVQEQLEVKKLRYLGYTYSEIKKKVPVSKNSISRWCSDIKLNHTQKLRVKTIQSSKRYLAALRGAEANKNRRIKAEKLLYQKGFNELGHITKRDRFVGGVALYIGDGTKSGNSLEFTNSDPKTVLFMFKWMKEFLNIDYQKMKAILWLHQNLDEDKAIKYWSKLLDIQSNQFHQTYHAVNKIYSSKIRKQIHPYGVIKIRYFDSSKLRLVKGWIGAVLASN